MCRAVKYGMVIAVLTQSMQMRPLQNGVERLTPKIPTERLVKTLDVVCDILVGEIHLDLPIVLI
jgi:hypothetical protein